ncbi:MAG: phosphoribosyltransferase [Candidatus Cyclobacteriaceae bacterium M3_2C_046]
MLNISFSEISQKLSEFQFPPVELVLGIARGGIIPAGLIAHQLQIPLHYIKVNYRDDQNQPRYQTPVLLDDFNLNWDKGARILLVDDVSVTGNTIHYVRQFLTDYQVVTFALKGKADLVLLPDIRSCVNWPWKSYQ